MSPFYWASAPKKEGSMDNEKKEAEIEYIINLLRKANPEKVHKLFICATNILT